MDPRLPEPINGAALCEKLRANSSGQDAIDIKKATAQSAAPAVLHELNRALSLGGSNDQASPALRTSQPGGVYRRPRRTHAERMVSAALASVRVAMTGAEAKTGGIRGRSTRKQIGLAA